MCEEVIRLYSNIYKKHLSPTFTSRWRGERCMQR